MKKIKARIKHPILPTEVSRLRGREGSMNVSIKPFIIKPPFFSVTSNQLKRASCNNLSRTWNIPTPGELLPKDLLKLATVDFFTGNF
ncbi:hypothetical protein C6500_09900 [Candidatus Poribacteria bacterium]|nr:MAG: hypothetical protein C6500_09900 [Candidatus Poribacteria bacterium]